jgi:hypothetical protein
VDEGSGEHTHTRCLPHSSKHFSRAHASSIALALALALARPRHPQPFLPQQFPLDPLALPPQARRRSIRVEQNNQHNSNIDRNRNAGRYRSSSPIRSTYLDTHTHLLIITVIMEHGARSIIPPIIPVTGRVFIWRPAVVHPSSQEETLTSNYHKVSNRNLSNVNSSVINSTCGIICSTSYCGRWSAGR